MSDILSSLAYLTGKPVASAKIKAQPEHFQVREDLGFAFTGEGEHLMVRIRKTGENTSFVANELAKACGVKSKDVSWAGLKDRHAVTEQWLSVHLPKGETPDFSAFLAQYPSIEILATDRHNKKLRPGDLIGNEFVVTLSEVTDVEDVEQRLEKVKQVGVPNYFGSQRFGNDGNNLEEARRWGRENVRTRNQNKRSMYLSAARSWIFNRIVSARLENGVFDKFIDGDIAQTSSGTQLVDAARGHRLPASPHPAAGEAQTCADAGLRRRPPPRGLNPCTPSPASSPWCLPSASPCRAPALRSPRRHRRKCLPATGSLPISPARRPSGSRERTNAPSPLRLQNS